MAEAAVKARALKKKFICRRCGQDFSTQQKGLKHIENDCEGEAWECPYCGRNRFSNKQNYREHVKGCFEDV